MKPELSVILVNFNDRIHLGDCLGALEKAMERLEGETILVDNGSRDGSQDLVRSSFPSVGLIENDENVGYARANNVGIRASRGDYILFLNTDTAVPPGALVSLLKEMKGDAGLGAAGPALVHEGGSLQVSFGKRVNFFSEIWQKVVLNPYYKKALKSSVRPRQVGWLSGACLLARRAAVEEAGLFDEDFFIYFEDIDLCLRMKSRGWKLAFFPAVRVVHVGGATTSARRLQARLEKRKSQLHFYRKHNSRASVFLLRTYLRINFALTGTLKLRKPEDEAWLRSQASRILRTGKTPRNPWNA